MSGHTPGPWNVEKNLSSGQLQVAAFEQEGEMAGNRHLQVIISAHYPDDVFLIAAAPTMFAAIKQFEAWWQEVGQVSFNGAPACVFALREAAAKARGEL